MNFRLLITRHIDTPHDITGEPYNLTYMVEPEFNSFFVGSKKGLEVHMTEEQYKDLAEKVRLAMEV